MHVRTSKLPDTAPLIALAIGVASNGLLYYWLGQGIVAFNEASSPPPRPLAAVWKW